MDFRQLQAEVIIGKDAEQFFKTDLGKYVLGCAQQDIDRATQELMQADPNDAKEIIRLQNQANVAQTAIQWLNDAIIIGRNALVQLESMEDANG